MLPVKNSNDFHWYTGRVLGLTNSEIENNLYKMIGERTDIFSHYQSLKLESDLFDRRRFLVEALKFYISDFLGTEYCEVKDEKKITYQSNLIELESLEKYLANAVLPDSSFDIWRDCIVEFRLKTPTEDVNLEGELYRLCLPECFIDDINKLAIKCYSPDRSLRNLAICALSNAETDEECATAELINLEYIRRYYNLMGIKISVKKFQKGKIGSLEYSKGSKGGENLPFLPKLPCNISYSDQFYSYINNRIRAEHNLFRLEWEFCKTIRFEHHHIIAKNIDKATNDLLSGVKGVNDIILLTKQNDSEQNKTMMLLLGDFGKCFFTLLTNNVKSDKTERFLHSWYDHDPEWIINAIQMSIIDGELNTRMMSRKIKKYFRREFKYQHIKDMSSCF